MYNTNMAFSLVELVITIITISIANITISVGGTIVVVFVFNRTNI